MPTLLPPLLHFPEASAPTQEEPSRQSPPPAAQLSTTPAPDPAFGDEPELPPTWSEHSRIFHTTEKCTRLQAIRRNRRITGNPGLRDHCLNCLDIVSTKRRG